MNIEELELRLSELEDNYLESTNNYQHNVKLYGFYKAQLFKNKILKVLNIIFGGCLITSVILLLSQQFGSIYFVYIALALLGINVFKTYKSNNFIKNNYINKESIDSIKSAIDSYLKSYKNDKQVIRDLEERINDLKNNEVNEYKDNSVIDNVSDKIKTFVKRR